MRKFVRINSLDNVAVALEDIPKATVLNVDGIDIFINNDIPFGHKFALCDIDLDDEVIKYGYSIGYAVSRINKGDLVSDKNIKTSLIGINEYKYIKSDIKNLKYKYIDNLSFLGYKRKNSDVGIRNELWIVPTVGCVNGIVKKLAELFIKETNGIGIDAIVPYTHNYGCSQLSDDHENTKKILRDLVLHPNAGGVLVVGLGCENNQPREFEKLLGEYDKSRIKFLITQEVDDEIEFGMNLLRQIYTIMLNDRREVIPFGTLRIGLKCGGSDGLSGITANPLLGEFSDFHVAQGGTVVLTEVPEMFGAETILMNRCKTEDLFNRTVSLINNFKSYFLRNNQPIYENPSPGNKAGGISTLEEKSLGCTQKSGRTEVCDVLDYGDIIKTSGLNLLSAPGNDLVASTALAATGCHIVLFTTGRGTPFGTFVPTVKISSNTGLYTKKKNWIDFNAGTLAEKPEFEILLKEFVEFLRFIANGKKTLNELNDYREISIFKSGVTL